MKTAMTEAREDDDAVCGGLLAAALRGFEVAMGALLAGLPS